MGGASLTPWSRAYAALLSARRPLTVVAPTCMAADAWATALMVHGRLDGADRARRHNLSALFIDRVGDGLCQTRVGWLFETCLDPRRAA